MSLRTLVFCSLFSLHVFAATGQAGAVQLSEEAEISIMTLGPYQGEIYSAFGHSAIHLKDPANNIDWVYNYGIFDFDQENFYWNFARGKMLYQLGLSRYQPFKNPYIREDRYIIEQRLNFTREEKQLLFDYLTENYKPENREYYYNYVYDNCATKIRDVILETFTDRITFNLDYAVEEKTIRDLMNDYLAYQPWGDWIIDIGLGMQIDREARAEEYMFLPDYIQAGFADATILRDSVRVPLVSETVQVYSSKNQVDPTGFFTPFNVFTLLFFVIGFITNRDFKKGKRTKWIDPVLFTLPGLLGWWLVFLWFGTEHLSENNLNLLWAIPFHLPLVYLLGVKKLQPFLSMYFLVVSCWYILLLILWGVLPQPLHEAIIPLVVTMILRGFYIRTDLRKQSKIPVSNIVNTKPNEN